MPALVSLFVRSRVRESEVWEETQQRQRVTRTRLADVIRDPRVVRRFVYQVLLMTAFNWMSHDTQDVYPTFLKEGIGLSATTATWIAVLHNIGALVGGTIAGGLSQGFGRRRTIILAAILALPIVPLFAIQERPADAHGYPFALTVTIIPVLVAVAVLTAIGTEARHVRFGSQETALAGSRA